MCPAEFSPRPDAADGGAAPASHALASTVIDTAIGPTGIAWGPHGVVAVQLPERSEAATRTRLARRVPDAAQVGEAETMPPPARRAADGITALLAGEPDGLRDVVVDLRAVPEFDRRVYTALREVGPGRTTTYGELAGAVGAPHDAREVGAALARNPVPLIVPCHRVLAADGKVGGFSAYGGSTSKLALLRIEGAEPDGAIALF
jgi:methylated-DNA-[protein]-cysteine S-methyltransferase